MLNLQSSTDDYNVMYSVGKGATSEVFYAKHKILNLPVAIKGIPKSLLIADKEKERFQQEVRILKEIDNEYISSLYDLFSDENNYYFVIDLAENGSFESIIKPEKPCTENHAKKYFSQLMSALSYIHNVQHIIHRDIKADNILLDKNFNIKLIDFGMSNLFDPTKNTKFSRVGSPAYISPEVVLNEEVTEKSDLWSAGVFLYFITAGHLPFMETELPQLFESIVNKEVEYPTYLSPQLRDLISHMLAKDPKDRPTIEEISTHPWLGHNKVTLYSPTITSGRSSNKSTPRSQKLENAAKMFPNSPPQSGRSDESDHKTTQIDRAAIDALKELGVDVTGIEDMIIAKQFNRLTAMYRIMKSSMKQPKGCGRVSLSGSSRLKLGATSQVKIKSLLDNQQPQKIITQPVMDKKKKGNFVGLRAGALGLSHKSNITVVKKFTLPLV